jgi:hypothetical protein
MRPPQPAPGFQILVQIPNAARKRTNLVFLVKRVDKRVACNADQNYVSELEGFREQLSMPGM